MPTPYVVKPGDTVGALAKQFGVAAADVSGYRSGDPNRIGVGETLQINMPTPAANTATVNDLGAKPFTAPTTKAYTAPASLASIAESTAGRVESLTPTVTQGREQIEGVYKNLADQETERSDLYESEGVNQKRKDLDDITAKIRARGLAARREVEAAEKNPEGKLANGVQIQVNDINRNSAREMADLAIVAEALQGNYTTAKEIVDRKVDSETEGLTTQLDGLKYFYSENKSELTKQQDSLLQQQINDLEDERDQKREMLKQIGEIQLSAAQNGAPASVIQAIGATKDLTAAAAASKGYLVTPTRSSGSGSGSVGKDGLTADQRKVETAFNADLKSSITLMRAGDREKFIDFLVARYPDLTEDSIKSEVYRQYPDGYEQLFRSTAGSSSGRSL